MSEQKRFACVLPPNFMRGALSIGGLYCLYDYGFKPLMITGCSGGAVAGASCIGWDEQAMNEAVAVWSNLRPKNIWSLRFADKMLLASAGVGPALHLLPEMTKYSKTEKGIKAALSLLTPTLSVAAVLKQPSFLSNEPLRKLLKDNLHFKKIFNSSVRFVAVSAECETGNRVLHTNFLPKDRDDDRFVSGLIASAAIPVFFPPEEMDGKILIDGICSHQDFLAIDIVEREVECDNILVFSFYDIPRGSPKSALEIGDQNNELRVRDAICGFLEALPEKTKKKIINVKLDRPIEKVSLLKFSQEELCNLIETGYRCTERVLFENGWIET